MFKLTRAINLIAITVITLSVVGCFDKHASHSDQGANGKQVKSEIQEYYTCSMHPHVREDGPGKCPICQMNLTKVVVDKTSEVENELDETKASYRCKNFPDVTSEKPDVCPLDGTSMIKVAVGETPGDVVGRVKLRKSQLGHFKAEVFEVTTMHMSKTLRVLGRVKSAEEKNSNIAARFPARVEKVFVESVGSYIRKGDPVVRVYSPELLTAGEELILSAEQSGQGGEFNELYLKAREKLILWGIRESQIKSWVTNKRVPKSVTLFANSSGVVKKRRAVEGQYFKEGQNYFELSDLSSVWVEMDVYEHDANLIQLGQSVEFGFVAIGSKKRKSEIDFVSPTIDEKTRTMKARATVDNVDGLLKPGMLAQGLVSVKLPGTPLVVPTPAIIDTGVRKIVWIKNGRQTYESRVVESGFQAEGYTEIRDGLKEGDKVVLEGSFLLDAQAQFFGGYEDFTGSSNSKTHNH